MVVVLNKKRVVAVTVTVLLVIAIVTAIAVPCCVSKADSPKPRYSVVIDAGHGGADGGVTGGTTGTPEAGINLAIARLLQQNFESAGIGVIMTRSTAAALAPADSKHPKKEDMIARGKIIREAEADLVISVHQNAFPLRTQRGAHVFYKKGSETGKAAAEIIQTQLNQTLPASDRVAQVGDYYVLNVTDKPAVLVECGFISNPEDEKNLLDETYREKVAYQIFIGAMSALNRLTQ